LAHLKTILNEAQDMVTNALKSTVPGRDPAGSLENRQRFPFSDNLAGIQTR